MRQRTTVAVLVATVLALTVVGVSALADLRSPEGTAELGRTLADDPAVRVLIAGAIVDAVMQDAIERSPAVAPLAPLVRPLLTRAAEATLATEAGRAAVASTLADAIRQTTRSGPIVIDLRAATLAAAEEAPPPLDTLARIAVEQGSVGLVVLGDDDGTHAAMPPGELAGRVAGLPSDRALAVAALLLAVGVGAAVVGGTDGRRGRLLGAGLPLVVVGAASALAVRVAPDAVVARVVTSTEVDAGPLADVLPTLVTGLGQLLGRTGTLGLVLAAVGVALVVAALSAAGSPRAADRPPRP